MISDEFKSLKNVQKHPFTFQTTFTTSNGSKQSEHNFLQVPAFNL